MGWRLELLILAATAATVAWLATALLIGPLGRRRIVDVPNRRSSHDRPTPRGGGLGLLAGFLASLGVAELIGYRVLDPFFLGALAVVAAAGWADDLHGGLPWQLRLLAQTVAAALVLARFGPLAELPLPEPAALPLGWAGWMGWAGWGLGLAWIVGVINLTNFLDGIDGFAAGQGLLAAAGLAVAGFFLGSPWLVACGLALAGAAAGFLPHNWHPARVFLGDVGSSSLGFVVAAAAWKAPSELRSELVYLSAMLLWFFLADGSFTLARRALGGERFWRPHRQHLYQRLVQTGRSHASVTRRVLLLGLLPAGLATLGAVRRSAALEWAALVAGLALFLLFALHVAARERHAR